MDSNSVKLYGNWASYYCHRVQLALHLKGIEYEYIEEDLSNKSSSLLNLNPVYKKVPVLLHRGQPIAESMVILRYLDDCWTANPIAPLDPYDRAMANFWCHFVHDKLGKSFRALLLASSSGDDRAVAADEFRGDLKYLEHELSDEGFAKGSKFFGGECIGLLDIVIGCGFHWTTMFEELSGLNLIDRETFPHFTAWYQNFMDSEPAKHVLPPTPKLIEYTKCVYKQMSQNADDN